MGMGTQPFSSAGKNSNRFSPGAPTPKLPQVDMSYGKRQARRGKGAGLRRKKCAIAAERR